MDIAFHEGTGTLYVSGNETLASGNWGLVLIDTDTNMVTGSNSNLGWSVKLVIDEARGRLYARGTSRAAASPFSPSMSTRTRLLET